MSSPAIKKGKLFMKDEEGNFVQIVPEASFGTPEYVGATATSGGVSGMVPAAFSSQRDKYLKGDGTWGEISLPDTYTGATENSDGIPGLVPAATSQDKDKFFRGDGNWVEVDISNAVHIEGEETIEGPKKFTQGPFSTVMKSRVSGTYTVNASRAQAFMLEIDANSTLEFTGVPSQAGAEITLYVNNNGSYTLSWPNNVLWASGGTAPALTSGKMDIYKLVTMNGGKSWYATRLVASTEKYSGGGTMFMDGIPECGIFIRGGRTDGLGGGSGSGSSQDEDDENASELELIVDWSINDFNIQPNISYSFTDIFDEDSAGSGGSNFVDAMSFEIKYCDEEGEMYTLTIAPDNIPGATSSPYTSALDDYVSNVAESEYWNYIYFSPYLSYGNVETYWFNYKIDANGNGSYYSNHDVCVMLSQDSSSSSSVYTVTFRRNS